MSDALVRSELRVLVAEALEGNLGKDQMQSLLEALYLFEIDGGAEGLISIAQSGLDSELRHKALALLFAPPPDSFDWHVPPVAHDLAQEFLSTGDEQFQGSVIDILLEQDDAVAELPSNLIKQICMRAIDSGQRRLVRQKAQQLLSQLLKHYVDDPQTLRDALPNIALTGLRVILNENDQILRLQFEQSSKENLSLAVDLVHRKFEGDDWELLAKAGHKLGILPKRPEGPALLWWPESKTQRALRMEKGLVGFLPSMLAGFVMALLLSLLFRATDNQDTTLPLLYLLGSAGFGAVLGSAVSLILPSIVLFPNRVKGGLAQAAIWVGVMGVLSFAIMYLLAVYAEYGDSYRGTILTRPFWESAVVLSLSLSLIRPVTLLAHDIVERRRKRYIWAIVLGTLIPVGALSLGVFWGVKDGLTLELQALFVGGPLAAALATACASTDNLTPDAAKGRSGLIGLLTVASASFVAAIAIVVVGINFLGAEETKRSLFRLGEEIPLTVPLRQQVRFDVLPVSGAKSADISSSSNASIPELDLTRETSTPLLPDDYMVCLLNQGQACSAIEHMNLMDRWRLMIDAIDVDSFGRSETMKKHVKEGFVRVNFIQSTAPEDIKPEKNFQSLLERYESNAATATDADQAFFLAREDNTIFAGASEWVLKKGSLVLRNSIEGEHYLTLIDGVRERRPGPIALRDHGIAHNEAFVQIDLPGSADLETIATYLSLVENPERYDRIQNQSAIFALENGLTFVGPPRRSDLLENQLVLSLAGAATSGAGVYRVIDASSSNDDIILQLEAGWSYVGNPDFCYRHAYDNSIVLLPAGLWKDSLMPALEEMAAASGAERLFLKPGEILPIDERQFCTTHHSEMQIEAAWRAGTAYSVQTDQGQVMLETEGDMEIFVRTKATSFVETIYQESTDGLVTLNFFEIRSRVNGEIESFCIQPINTDVCQRYLANPDEDTVDLPSPGNSFILPYWNRVVEGERKQAAAFSDFITTFTPLDIDTTEMDGIGIIRRDVSVMPRTVTPESKQGVDQKQIPINIIRGSLLSFDDGPRVLIGLTRSGKTFTGPIDDPGLTSDTLISLDVSEAKQEFPTLLRYVHEVARWGGARQPDAAAIGQALEFLGIEQIQQGEVIRQAAMSDLSESEFGFESRTEMFAVIRKEAGVFETLAFETVDQDEVFRLQIPLKSDEVLCFASRGYAAECAHKLGLTWPVLMTDPRLPELNRDRPILQDHAISSADPIAEIFRLDTMPEDLNEFSVRGGDLVIELYLADGSRDWQDSDNLRDENDLNDGEIVDLTRMTNVTGICVRTIGSDGSCPNTVSRNAPQLFPLLDGGNEIVFDVFDNIIGATNRPQGPYWLPFDWVADQGVRRVRSDEYFQAVVRLVDGKFEKIAAERTQDGFIADVTATNSPGAVALCIERNSAEGTCGTFWTNGVELPLRAGPEEINFIAQDDR